LSLDEAFARAITEKEAALLRPAASQISAASKEYGFFEVYVYPALDPVIASSILLHVLNRFKVRYSVYVTPIVPRDISGPAVLIGYPAAVAYEVNVKRTSVLVGYGEPPTGITSLTVTASNDASISGLMTGVLSELTVVGPVAAYSLVAGFWRGTNRGKKGEFTGVEAGIIEVLSLENIVEPLFSVKLVQWLFEPTENALALTWLPYLPGLTEDVDASKRFLESDPRLSELKGKTVEDVSEEAVAVLGEKLYELLKSKSRVPRRPTEIIGMSYYSHRLPVRDLREAASVLACTASAKGLESLLGFGIADKLVYSAAYALFRLQQAKTLSQYIRRLLDGERRPVRRIAGVELTVLPHTQCVLNAEKELRSLGVVKPESLAGFQYGEEKYLVSMESLIGYIGYEKLEELINSKCLDYVDGYPYGVLNEGQC
jgi:single-stranded-DNA-specific exonuclease